MTSNLPRYRQRPTGGMPLLVKAGIFMLLPLLAVGGIIVAITDGAPTVTARAEGGSRLPDFETPGTSSTSAPGGVPSGTPTEGDDTPSPAGSPTPSPEETGEDESSSGTGTGSGSGSGSGEAGEDEDLVATTPPREPGQRPTSPDEPTDDPSTPQDPDPSPEPSEPSEPPEPEPTEDPTDEPTDDPDSGLPLPILELSQAETQMVEAVDEARAEAGCPALRVDPRLTLASRAHSEDMRERSYYAHVNPDGEGPEERAADKGYTAEVGENLSQGVRSAQQVVRSWEDGGDERDRLLDCSYTSVGVGTERGGLLGLSSWWTLMLGTD